MKNLFKISASLVCGDLLDLRKRLIEVNDSDVEYIHIDIMDGDFVPRFGLSPEILPLLKNETNKLIDVHLMINNVDKHIETIAKNGADIIYVHVENNKDLNKTLKLIKQYNKKTGIVLNIATDINFIKYIIDDLDYVMLMGISPGIIGQKLNNNLYEKIRNLRNNYGNKFEIMIDGGVNQDTAAKLINAGANILVCGTSSIFKSGTIKENVNNFRKIVESDINEI